MVAMVAQCFDGRAEDTRISSSTGYQDESAHGAEIKANGKTGDLEVSSEAKRLLQLFLEQHPPQRLSMNLRKMLLHSLISEGGLENGFLGDLLYDLDGLFDLIDAIQIT